MVRVGIIQSNITSDKEHNLDNALALASKEQADFIVFPELFTTGYTLDEKLAEDDQGNTVNRLSKFARDNNTNVIGGSIIEKEGNSFYNTSYVITREGKVIGRYSKRNLFRPLDEHKFFTTGVNREGNYNTFKLDGINIGIMICYDLRFSSIIQDMIQSQVELIFCPMQWPSARTKIREGFARVRAAESFSYLITANATGYDINNNPSNRIKGHSSISSPSGDCLFQAGKEEGIFVQELDLSQIDNIKKFFKGGK